jgi:hypothetical protein
VVIVGIVILLFLIFHCYLRFKESGQLPGDKRRKSLLAQQAEKWMKIGKQSNPTGTASRVPTYCPVALMPVRRNQVTLF